MDRDSSPSWQDREAQRPALAIRRLSVGWDRGHWSLEAGKQAIRWGKTDILNPTDRFAPRDFLNVIENDFLPVSAVRLTYGTQTDSLDAVWSPRFTPSRVPLLGMRWAPLPEGLAVAGRPPDLPGGQQVGLRWNHVGRAAEYSLSVYDGYNHLPLIRTFTPPATPRVELQRYYPRLRGYGADAAVPLRWVTVKAESAWFASPSSQADTYVLYVVQAERQAGEWFFIAGYAGQAVVRRRSPLDFSPERGFTRAAVLHAGYTIDSNRSLALESVVRRDGKGLWTRLEYTQAVGRHWRATVGFALIRGSDGDFLGQFHRNSHGILTLRYSF